MDENEGITVDVESGVEHVKEMWRCLGIGQKGYLTVSELGTVCRHIGMEDMQDWEVHQLFEQLDANGNGQVTFDEFMNEMFQHSSTAAEKISPLLTPTPKISRTKSRRRKSFIRKTGMSTYESFFLSPGNSSLSFTTLDTNSRGFIKSEDLMELWESYGISNAVDVLKAYNIEMDRELSHTKLAAVLEDELLFTADHSPKLQAAIITCLQECKNLRCLLEEASQEKDRLIIGLRESNIRSQILAEEDDERHVALEKTLQHRLQSVEGFYQEQIKNLKEELKKDREERMDMIDEHDTMVEKMNNSYEEDNRKLKETLGATQEDLRQTQTELNESRERLRDMEKQKHKLQYQLSVEKLKTGGKKSFSEQKELMQVTSDAHSLMRQQISQLLEENKILGDRLEELSPQNRRPNHRNITGKNLARSMSLREQSLGEIFPGSIDILNRLTPRGTDQDEFNQMQRELKQLKKNIEIEHKEIEHAYLIEIAQIEERHSYEMVETLKQATKEKEKLLEEQTKRQQEHLAKLEKELQTQFAIEKQDLLLKHESEKNLLEQKLAEDKICLTEMLRSEYMEDLQRKIRELERCFNNEREQWKKLGWPVRQESPDTNSVELARSAVSPPLALDNAPSPGSELFSETSSNSFATTSVAYPTGSATPTCVSVSTVNTVSSCGSTSGGSGGGGGDGGSSEITFATCSVSFSVDDPLPCPSSLPENVSCNKDNNKDVSIPTDSTGSRAVYTLPEDIQEVTLECVPHHYSTKNTRNGDNGTKENEDNGTKENEDNIDYDSNDDDDDDDENDDDDDVDDDDDDDSNSGDSGNLAIQRRNSQTIYDDYKANDSKSCEDDVVDGSPDVSPREPQQSQQQRQEQSDKDEKKVIIQLCCMEQLHNVDNIHLQRIFDKDMDAKLKNAFIKAFTKHRNEEFQKSNKVDQNETAIECNDFADNQKFPNLWVRRASDEPKPKLSSLQRCREKVLKMETDRRLMTQKYEDKLRQQDREMQKLRNKFVEMSDTPKDYSVKTAVTNFGYHLLFPRQKYNKSTQTDRRGHLHRNMSDLHLKCFYQEEKLHNLEKEISQREEHSNTIMKKVEDTYRNVINEIEGEREQLKYKLISTEEAFQDQSGKLLEQQSKSKNRDLLLKDLYLQNAELMRSLQQLEEQLRLGDQKNMQLEEKCRVLDKVLQKILVDDAYDDLVPDIYKNTDNNSITTTSSNNNNNNEKTDEVRRKSRSDLDINPEKNRNRKLFEFGRNKKQFERNLQDRKKRELFLKCRHLSCEFFTSLKNPFCDNMADIYQCNVESGFILDEISRVMENLFKFLDAGQSKERDGVKVANRNNLAAKETACGDILRCGELVSLQDSLQDLGENQTLSVSLSKEFPTIDVYTDAEEDGRESNLEDEIGIRVDTEIKDGEDDTVSYSDDYSIEFNRSTHLDILDQTVFSAYSNSVSSLREEIGEHLDSCQTASSYMSADENINDDIEADSDDAECAGSCISKDVSDSATNRTYTCNYVTKITKERDKHDEIVVNDEDNDDDDDDDDDDANYDDLSFDNETDATEIDENVFADDMFADDVFADDLFADDAFADDVFADDNDDDDADMGVVCEDLERHSNSKHFDCPNVEEERNDVNGKLLVIKEKQQMESINEDSMNEEKLESKSNEIVEMENEAAEMKKIAVQIKHWADKIEKEVVKIESEVVKIENVTEDIGQNMEQDVYMETKDKETQNKYEIIRNEDGQSDNELGEDESKTVNVEYDCNESEVKKTISVWLTEDERELIALQSRMEFLEELSVNYSILQQFLLISDDPTTGAMVLPVVRWMWDIFKRMQY